MLKPVQTTGMVTINTDYYLTGTIWTNNYEVAVYVKA